MTFLFTLHYYVKKYLLKRDFERSMVINMENSRNFQEMEYLNKRFLNCYEIIAGILFAAYMIELIKGNRTLGYTAVFCMSLQ